MRWSSEQIEQIQNAKAAGEKRVTLSFTAEQKNRWRAAVEEELTGKEENLAYFRKAQAAAQQPGFFGDVRRAINLSRRSAEKLANEIGVESRLLSDFPQC
jgi:hypothetical protein